MDSAQDILKPLKRFAWVAAVGFISSLLAMTVDSREIINVSIWVQPAKLWMSFGVYTASLYYILPPVVSVYPRLTSIAVRGTVLCFSVGMVVVLISVYFGAKPHFSFETPLESAIFLSISVIIGLVWLFLISLIKAIFSDEVSRICSRDESLRMRLTCARIGLVIVAMTSMSSNVMSLPRGWQLVEYQMYGAKVFGSHLFGQARDGDGTMIPILGWSSQYGDLRVSHFLGLHSLQLMIFFGMISRNRWRAQLLGGSCFALWFSTYLQGLSGQPVTHMGGLFFLTNSVALFGILTLFLVEGSHRINSALWASKKANEMMTAFRDSD